MFKKALWCLCRPRLYPEVARHFRRRIVSFLRPGAAKRQTRAATAWCHGVAVDTPTALKIITGRDRFEPVADRFPDDLREARQREARCPVKMGGPGNLDLLYWLADHAGATRVIETGVAYGWSSMALLLSLRDRGDAQLVSTDRPYPGADEQYVGCVVPESDASRWTILDKADREALPVGLEMLPEIDLCHYDSDKSPEGRHWAYPRLWEALRPGGIFISDDVGDDFAFRDFARQVNQEPIVVRTAQDDWDKFVGVLVKPIEAARNVLPFERPTVALPSQRRAA